MTHADMVQRVKELAGPTLSDDQVTAIIGEVVRMSALEAPVEYETCSHTSTDMLRHYGETGLCGICIHDRNRRLSAMVKESAVGATVGSLMIGALTTHAMANRFCKVIDRYAKCERCGIPLLDLKRHGCHDCRQDRGWLAKMVKRPGAKSP